MATMPVAGLPSVNDDPVADIVVRNAKVYTGDPVRPQASAVAIKDGKVTVVGDDKDVAPWSAPGPEWSTRWAAGSSPASTTPTCT